MVRTADWNPDAERARRAALGWQLWNKGHRDIWRVIYGPTNVPCRLRYGTRPLYNNRPDTSLVDRVLDHETLWRRRDAKGAWEYALACEPYLRPEDVDYAALTAWCYRHGIVVKHDGQALHNSGCYLFWFEREGTTEAEDRAWRSLGYKVLGTPGR